MNHFFYLFLEKKISSICCHFFDNLLPFPGCGRRGGASLAFEHTSMVQAEVVNHYQQVLVSLLLPLHLSLYLLKVTRGQHIKAGGREESSQLTWREEGSSLLAWRREDKKDDKESLLSWRRSTLKDGRCHLCRVAGAQRRLRGARRGQEVDQPRSRHAGGPHPFDKKFY